MPIAFDTDFYNEEYFLGTSGQRGNFSLLELGPKFHDRTQAVVDYFDLENEKPGTVVEAGCGTAPFCRIIRQNSKLDHIEVIATDITESGINLLDASNRPPFKHAGAEELPFESSSLLGIVEWDVLEHLNHPEKAIIEAYRALRLNGFLHIVCPNPDSWLRNDIDPDKDPYRRDKSHIFPPIVTVDFLDKTLHKAGFTATIYTRGFEGTEGQSQMGINAMKLARYDKTGSHIVVFARKA